MMLVLRQHLSNATSFIFTAAYMTKFIFRKVYDEILVEHV